MLILVLVAIVVVVALTVLGGVTRDTFLGNFSNAWSNAT